MARPRTRGDCADGIRPCPWVSCRHHLYLDVFKEGAIRVGYPKLEPGDIPETCSLDMADTGEATLEEIASVMGLTKERIRQIEEQAMRNVRNGKKRAVRLLKEMSNE